MAGGGSYVQASAKSCRPSQCGYETPATKRLVAVLFSKTRIRTMFKNAIILLVLFVLLGSISACTSIQTYRTIEQPENKKLYASVGSVIFRLNKTSDLPNAYGKADIYGGKVDKGYAELTLVNINPNQKLAFKVQDVNMHSSETTMDRYMPLMQNSNISINTSLNVNSNQQQPVVVTSLSVDPSKEKYIVVSGIKIEILKVNPHSIEYTITDTYK